MPQRKILLVNNEFYHIFNRSINKEPIFVKQRDCQRSLKTISYYMFKNPPIRLSYFLALGQEKRFEITKTFYSKIVDVVSFALMPNHFHFLLKQNEDKGISKFLALFENSYTRYFNTKNNRQGHVFQGQFKAVRIEDDDQLLHVNRYIHLNPYSSYVVKTLADLESYPYSSFPEFLNSLPSKIYNKEIILDHFPAISKYKEFVFDQANYQRKLEEIKHLILE